MLNAIFTLAVDPAGPKAWICRLSERESGVETTTVSRVGPVGAIESIGDRTVIVTALERSAPARATSRPGADEAAQREAGDGIDDLQRAVEGAPHERRRGRVAAAVDRARVGAQRVTHLESAAVGNHDLDGDDRVEIGSERLARRGRRGGQDGDPPQGASAESGGGGAAAGGAAPSSCSARFACSTQRSASGPRGGWARNARRCWAAPSGSPRFNRRKARP